MHTLFTFFYGCVVCVCRFSCKRWRPKGAQIYDVSKTRSLNGSIHEIYSNTPTIYCSNLFKVFFFFLVLDLFELPKRKRKKGSQWKPTNILLDRHFLSIKEQMTPWDIGKIFLIKINPEGRKAFFLLCNPFFNIFFIIIQQHWRWAALLFVTWTNLSIRESREMCQVP